MQKKLIALAVAGLLSAPAFAQSNVTLYGTIDFGFVSTGSNHDEYTNGDKIKNRNALDSGIAKANRIGVKGVEDLGNGLKAVFVLENGMVGDTTGTGFFNGVNRQTYAGLAGAFGTVAFGRQYTPQHLFTASVDPFGKQGLGGAGNVLFQDRRLSNLAAYISPDFGGFKFIVGYSFEAGVLKDQESIENNNDVRVWAVAPSFTWNNLFVGANYHTARMNRDNSTGASSQSLFNAYDLFASYDFGFVKVGSTIGRRTTKKEVANLATPFGPVDRDSKITQFMIGATFKITPNDSIMTSYSRASENKVYDNYDKLRIDQFAIGYEHALSKRTALYSQFSMIGRNKAVKDDYGVYFSTLGDNGRVGDVMASVGANTQGYRRGFAIGMRHDF